MPEIKFDIPAYDAAMNQFVSDVIHGFISLDPLIGKFPTVISSHRGPIRNVRTPVPLDQQLFGVEAGAELNVDAVRYSNIEEYSMFLH